MSGDLVGFIAKRYDEAEALAKAAAADGTPEWHLSDSDPIDPSRIYDAKGEVVVYDEGAPSPNEAEHIAACDPAHRLADIALKRAILAVHKGEPSIHDEPPKPALYCTTCGTDDGWYNVPAPCPTVRHLGTEFSGHPDYLEEWRP